MTRYEGTRDGTMVGGALLLPRLHGHRLRGLGPVLDVNIVGPFTEGTRTAHCLRARGAAEAAGCLRCCQPASPFHRAGPANSC